MLEHDREEDIKKHDHTMKERIDRMNKMEDKLMTQQHEEYLIHQSRLKQLSRQKKYQRIQEENLVLFSIVLIIIC